MTTTTTTTRVLALIGIAAAAVAGFFFIVRPLVLSSDEEATAPAAQQTKPKTSSTSVPRTAHTVPAKPKVMLLPGLPAPIAKQLRYDRVVVVSVFARPAQVDRQAVVKARTGAHAAGAGFVAVNLYDEESARAAEPLVGTASPPAVLVVRRPGKVVNRLQGSPDSALVAQAAHNAGAR
jgi:hypothetical protein